MKEKIKITLEDLDDIKKVLKSVQLLFQLLIDYYVKTNIKNLKTLIYGCGVYFGKLLTVLGYDETNMEEENEN
jgi:hypothetical protein